MRDLHNFALYVIGSRALQNSILTIFMLTIFMTIISRTKFEDQLIKATDVVEPQSCRKSRKCRFLVIFTIFKLFGRDVTRSKFENLIFKLYYAIT